MNVSETILSIAQQAKELSPADRLGAIEQILLTLDLNHPTLSDLYERIADIEAKIVSDSIESGEMETTDFQSMMTSLRSRYAH